MWEFYSYLQVLEVYGGGYECEGWAEEVPRAVEKETGANVEENTDYLERAREQIKDIVDVMGLVVRREEGCGYLIE